MKKFLCLAAGLLALQVTSGFGQQPGSTFAERLAAIQAKNAADEANAPAPTKFNLDFPGGTPKQLVAAIEKAMGKPLNVIIPEDAATTKLPPVKVNDMDAAKLFQTLSENAARYTDTLRGNIMIKNYGFKTIDARPSDNSLWTFYSYTKSADQTQFSLDFPGGSPTQLVKAIEKAMGKHLNVIISKEDETIELPPLKMDDVFLPQLFTALEVASHRDVNLPNGPASYQHFITGYGFKSADEMTDTAVWYFHVEKPSLPPVVSTQKICQYYSLAPYLDRGFTVDDITTAIQTGWKMADVAPTPELSYHKETKMLIAFGEPAKLKTIEDVLRTLPQTQISLPALSQMVKDLQNQVSALRKQVPLPPPGLGGSTPPAEKSGN